MVVVCAKMNLFEMLHERMHIIEMDTTAGVVAALEIIIGSCEREKRAHILTNSPSRSDALTALTIEPRSLSIDDDVRAYLSSPCLWGESAQRPRHGWVAYSTRWAEGEPAMNLLAKEPCRQEMGEPMK
jgi:hypothetical protein